MEYNNHLESTINRFKKLHKIANIGNWELEYSSGIVVWSDVACEIYGLSVDDNVHSYEVLEAFIHPEDLKDVKTAIAAAEKTMQNYNLHHRIVRKDGTIRHLHSQIEYQFNNEGIPVTRCFTNPINLVNKIPCLI